MRFPADRVLRPNPGERAPAPGHPVYSLLAFAPLEERTPAMKPGGYTGEITSRTARSLVMTRRILRQVGNVMAILGEPWSEVTL